MVDQNKAAASAKKRPSVATGKQSMTAEKAKALGLDPKPYGKPRPPKAQDEAKK
ncbi:hypothetical protein [Mesorhizobium xinjiangense]|uniref:hypothetical protein n=1 Tax=Mesorhizobium xinjiangense TaxID=2678685 RepID=UPI0012ECC575|nr:hypothetical protein [Mesorhizobium xinjiangense]